ncbi:MAG: hypothetical protein PHY95_00860 [Candidatus ainarchaeum sp.]|nr:hypothetical protein [Candidatus ainarchaeum sp.]
MRPNYVFALGLFFLFSITLHILGYDYYAILLSGAGILLGTLIPSLDGYMKCRWGHLKILILVLSALLVYFSYIGSYAMCFYLLAPFCENVLFISLLVLTALFLVFDLMNPLSPPLHGLIPLVLFTLAYSMLLLWAGQPPADSFVSICAFFTAYLASVLGSAMKLNSAD